MIDYSVIIKNYPNISKVFTQDWFEKEITKNKNEMHLLVKQFTFTGQNGSSLDNYSLQYIDFLEELLKDMEVEINSQEDHFKRLLGTNKKNNYIENKKDYTSTLAQIEIGSFFKKMGFKIEFETPIPGKKDGKGDIKIDSDGVEVFIEVSIKERPRREDCCIFSWGDIDNISGNDNDFLVHYLKLIYNIDLEETKIEKIDSVKTIKVSFGAKYILLKLNNEEMKVYLQIDDGRTDEFIVKNEKDKLKVCENPNYFRKIKFTQPQIYGKKLDEKNGQLSESNPKFVALYLDPASIPEMKNVIKGLGFDLVWKKNGIIDLIEGGEHIIYNKEEEHIINTSMISAVLLYFRSFSNNKYNIFKILCLNPKAGYELPDSLITKFRNFGTRIINPVPYKNQTL